MFRTALIVFGAVTLLSGVSYARQSHEESVPRPPNANMSLAQDTANQVGMCSKGSNWTCSSGSCIKIDSASGYCCPSGYTKVSMSGTCSR